MENKNPHRFELINTKGIGIDFQNNITESDSVNMLEFTNIYNGAGIGVGDFNNDGQPDIYFAGNTVSSKLYINRTEGDNISFQDITDLSGVATERWATGVSVVDLNLDGLLDIYVCVSGDKNPERRKNYMFMNTGISKGIPIFQECASAFGIADTSYSSQAVFFDFDKDNDLDLLIGVNYPENFYGSSMNRMVTPALRISQRTDRLYRNEGYDDKGNLTFVDVSKESGIAHEGYTLGISVMDLNKDSWPDVYLSNDFLTNDIIYMNNGDGTFTNKLSEFFKHTTFAGMGNDVGDFNNDGLLDIMVLDMIPDENERFKTMMKATDYHTHKIRERLGYYQQYNRNTLQLNNGIKPDGNLSFSEIGRFANVHYTDWSWSVLFGDFNNSGWKDLFITNGFRRDMQHQDVIRDMFRNFSQNDPNAISDLLNHIDAAPEVYVSNKFFQNNQDLTYKDVSNEWSLSKPSFSSGAVLLDIEGDGDLDVVASNLNESPFIYLNNTRNERHHSKNSNFLRIEFSPSMRKQQLYGSEIEAIHGKNKQYVQYFPVHGYLSSFDHVLHFGLGCDSTASIKIKFPNNECLSIEEVAANETLVIDTILISEKCEPPSDGKSGIKLFEEIENGIQPVFKHKENDFNDFNVQPLIQKKYSQLGPGIAVGDIDMDGLDDIFVGGAFGQNGAIYRQMKDGYYTFHMELESKEFEDLGSVFFDADNDGDLDLYVTSGGVEFSNLEKRYLDRFYMNDGSGNFTYSSDALPDISTSTFCVNPCDFDRDGDLDLFVGGNVDLKNYPSPPGNYLLLNQSHNQSILFTDVTEDYASGLSEIGVVTSSLWTDFNNDGFTDLIVVGEWMPITFYKNENGKFINVTEEVAGFSSTGFWNSINGADFDKDGDIDYVIGNIGLNYEHKFSEENPLMLLAFDFDNNGKVDPFLFMQKGKEVVPLHSRDLFVRQIPSWETLYPTFASYAQVTIDDFLQAVPEGKTIKKLVANESRSIYLENLGNQKFKKIPFDNKLQVAPVKQIEIRDFNADGDLDLIFSGNDYSRNFTDGPIDASIGFLLLGDGGGAFDVKNGMDEGLMLDFDINSLVLSVGSKTMNLIVGHNDNSLKIIKLNQGEAKFVRVRQDETKAEINYLNGKRELREFYFSGSYLSSSSRGLFISDAIQNLRFFDVQGELSREIVFNMN